MPRALLARLWPFSTGNPEGDDLADPVEADLAALDEDDLDAPDEDDAQIRTWEFIPEWQYDGWQVQNGGHAIAEQEKALAEIQAKAEAIEAAEAAAGDAAAAAEAVAEEAGVSRELGE